jgi:hypothetical protein
MAHICAQNNRAGEGFAAHVTFDHGQLHRRGGDTSGQQIEFDDCRSVIDFFGKKMTGAEVWWRDRAGSGPRAASVNVPAIRVKNPLKIGPLPSPAAKSHL